MTLTSLALDAGVALATCILFFPTALMARRRAHATEPLAPAPAQPAEPISLVGLADALLVPVGPRDAAGYVYHPALPDLDEGANYPMLLEAFGLAVEHIDMDSDCDDEALKERVWDGESCLPWTPSAPQGTGWNLICVAPTEDGPYATFVRRLSSSECRERESRPSIRDARTADGLRQIVHRLMVNLDVVAIAATKGIQPQFRPIDPSARRALEAIDAMHRELQHLRGEPGQRGAAA